MITGLLMLATFFLLFLGPLVIGASNQVPWAASSELCVSAKSGGAG